MKLSFIFFTLFLLVSCTNNRLSKKQIKSLTERYPTLIEVMNESISVSDAMAESRKENKKLLKQLSSSKKLRNKAKAVDNLTLIVLKYLAKYEKELKQHCNHVDSRDIQCQEGFNLGSNKNGKAYEFAKILNTYTEELNDIDDTFQFKKLALPAKAYEMFKNDPDNKDKDFAQLNFQETPIVAVWAIISQYRQEIVQHETKALELLVAQLK